MIYGLCSLTDKPADQVRSFWVSSQKINRWVNHISPRALRIEEKWVMSYAEANTHLNINSNIYYFDVMANIHVWNLNIVYLESEMLWFVDNII